MCLAAAGRVPAWWDRRIRPARIWGWQASRGAGFQTVLPLPLRRWVRWKHIPIVEALTVIQTLSGAISKPQDLHNKMVSATEIGFVKSGRCLSKLRFMTQRRFSWELPVVTEPSQLHGLNLRTIWSVFITKDTLCSCLYFRVGNSVKNWITTCGGNSPF